MSSLVQTATMAVEGLKKRKRDGESKTKKKVSIQEPAQQDSTVIRVTSVMQPQFSAPVVGTSRQKLPIYVFRAEYKQLTKVIGFHSNNTWPMRPRRDRI